MTRMVKFLMFFGFILFGGFQIHCSSEDVMNFENEMGSIEDSSKDIFALSEDGSVRFYDFKQSSYSFRASKEEAKHYWGTLQRTITGDFDEDGDLDSIYRNPSKGLVVSLNLGNGNKNEYSLNFNLIESKVTPVLGDFDGDKDQDILLVDNTIGLIFMSLNDGKGRFGEKFVVANTLNDSLYTVSPRNDGSQTYELMHPQSLYIKAGDFNRDGFDDLVLTHSNQYIVYAKNTGLKGGFDFLPSPSIKTSEMGELAIGDVELDGDLDIAFAINESNPGKGMKIPFLRNQTVLNQDLSFTLEWIHIPFSDKLSAYSTRVIFYEGHDENFLLFGNLSGLRVVDGEELLVKQEIQLPKSGDFYLLGDVTGDHILDLVTTFLDASDYPKVKTSFNLLVGRNNHAQFKNPEILEAEDLGFDFALAKMEKGKSSIVSVGGPFSSSNLGVIFNVEGDSKSNYTLMKSSLGGRSVLPIPYLVLVGNLDNNKSLGDMIAMNAWEGPLHTLLQIEK